MKTLALIFGFILISLSGFSQDLIIRTNGTTLECRIISVDSTYANFTFWNGSLQVETRLEMARLYSKWHWNTAEFLEQFQISVFNSPYDSFS